MCLPTLLQLLYLVAQSILSSLLRNTLRYLNSSTWGKCCLLTYWVYSHSCSALKFSRTANYCVQNGDKVGPTLSETQFIVVFVWRKCSQVYLINRQLTVECIVLVRIESPSPSLGLFSIKVVFVFVFSNRGHVASNTDDCVPLAVYRMAADVLSQTTTSAYSHQPPRKRCVQDS